MDRHFNESSGSAKGAARSTVRPAAVAGLFYPEEPHELRSAVANYLGASGGRSPMPKALVVPHAGYIYSGPVAGTAYASLRVGACSLRRVVLLGPSHRTWFRGLALPSVEAFETPLGAVPVQQSLVGELRRLPSVVVSDQPHALEHSLEVQLPFIQHVAPDAAIVPIVAGDATPGEVAAVIDATWGGDETLIVVSSDLSHYNSYATAQAFDAETARAILEGREDLEGQQACGCVVLNGLARARRKRGLRGELLDLRNSGDTAGDKQRVVGYGAFGFHDA
jgi:MEMO1 family protein